MRLLKTQSVLFTTMGYSLVELPILFNRPTKGSPVPWSKDLERILAIPKRTPIDGVKAAAKWTEILKRENNQCDCVARWGYCIKEFNAIQGEALEEFERVGGLLGAIGVGHGKTGISLFLPLVSPDTHVALLLIPAHVRQQLLERDYPQWSAHFNTPSLQTDFKPGMPLLHVLSYSELSLPKNSDILARIRPDLIIADEAHSIKDRKRPRFKRILRLVKDKPDVKFAFMSGTMTSKSIKDYAHLAHFALGDGSPLPHAYQTLDHWSAAIDALDYNCDPGKLEAFKIGNESIREAFQRRYLSTPGVVATQTSSVDCSLTIIGRCPSIPSDLDKLLKDTLRDWKRPDGEELVEAKDLAIVARQLSLGFYYRMIFPHGEPIELVERWFEVRQAYHKELRNKLKYGGEHMDSPKLLEDAAERYLAGERGTLTWESEFYEEWKSIRSDVNPETQTVWVSDFALNYANEWTSKYVGIVWCEFTAFANRLAKLSGAPYFGGGLKAGLAIQQEKGDRSIIASIAAHCTGKNLQVFDTQLVTTPPSDGAIWEQLIGRTHRQGQKADEVIVEVFQHTQEYRDALKQAKMRSFYMQETQKNPQKLCYATYDLTERNVTGKVLLEGI
jgi:hypothetical protein